MFLKVQRSKQAFGLELLILTLLELGTVYGQQCANTFRFCEFEEVQLHYSQLSDTLGYDITTKKTK